LRASSAGRWILGRASQKQVVNATQPGGLCATTVGRHEQAILPPTPASSQ